MTVLQLALVTSGTPKAEQAADHLRSIYQFAPIDRAEVIVALGGDGLMLHSLHEFRDVAVVEIRQDHSSPQRILFDRDRTLSERIIGEQFET